jgi:hypothetical protein
MKVHLIRLKDFSNKSNFLLLITLALSMFTYLWNPLGVIWLQYDEATYIGNAIHVLVAHSPQESTFYNHPYFGQLFLAGLLKIIDYPNSLHPSALGDVVSTVKTLWFVPRLLIGLVAVIDTFLVYKIAERRFNVNVAFISAILFAVMPVVFLRTMFLESLQLPFLLSSILFALYVKDSTVVDNKTKNLSMILLSGICMGLAIFTKIPVFMIIPMVGYLIFTNNKNITALGLWFIPVILIPLIWPAYALVIGEIQYWWDGIYYQTHRQVATAALTAIDLRDTFSSSIEKNFFKAPILLSLGLVGLAYAGLKKDFFLLLWTIPFLVFLYFIGLVRDFHLIPILPALCISGGRVIADLIGKIEHRKVRRILSISIISTIVIIGLINFVSLIKINNDAKFEEVAFVLRYLEENKSENITSISTHEFSWIPKYVFQLGSNYLIPELGIDESPQNAKVLMVVDGVFKDVLSTNDAIGKHLNKIYNSNSKGGTTTIQGQVNNIIIPDSWPSNLTRYAGIDLINNSNLWKPNSKSGINIWQRDDNLTVLVNTSKADGITRHAFLQTQLKNLTETPLLLFLNYATISPNSHARFSVEIRDNGDQNTLYFRHDLKETSGNLEKTLFILPDTILNKALEIRLRIETDSTGENVMTIKRANIM